MTKVVKLIILLVLVCNAGVYAQTDGKDALKDFRYKEKMRVTPQQVEGFLKSNDAAAEYLDKKSKKYQDKVLEAESGYISNNSLPESELHAAVNPTDHNNIVVSPIRQNPNNMLKSLTCPVFYTKDGGTSWNESNFETFTLGENSIPLGGGDPMFTFDAKGDLYFSWIYLYGEIKGMSIDSIRWGIFVVRSTDGGVTFQAEDDPIIGNARGAAPATSGLEDMHDKQWLAADLSSSHYRNNVYASLVSISQTSGYQMQLFTKEADNSNFDYEPVIVSPPGLQIVQFGTLDVDNNGWVHVMFFGDTGSDPSMYHAVSKDGGKSIDKVTRISGFYGTDPIKIQINEQQGIPTPEGLSRIYPAPNITIDKSGGQFDGYLYATWTATGINSDLGNGLDVYFSKSSDGGETWSDAVVLNDNTENLNTDQFYTAQMVSPDGKYAVAWYDRRDDINNVNTHYYYAISKDGGETFSKNKAVTTLPSDFSVIDSKNADFGIGEYNQLIITEDFFMPIWADGRNNDGNVNIMFAKETFTGVEENPTFGMINSGISNLVVSPMPIANKATLKANIKDAGDYTISIYSISGEKVFEVTKQFTQGEITTDLNLDLSAGSYFLKLSNNSTYLGTKIIVE